MAPCVTLQCVIVVFPDHIHLLFDCCSPDGRSFNVLTDRSKVVLLLYLFCYLCLPLPYYHVSFVHPSGHLLGKG